jgi:hypothetical protein
MAMTQATTPAQTSPDDGLHGIRYLRKDIGVGIVVALFLLTGFLIGQFTIARTQTFAPADDPFRISYPTGWVQAPTLIDDALLKVQNPVTDSAVKTTLTVESRDIDAVAPPTLQDMLDRRIEQRQALTGYHFLSNKETSVDGEKAMQYNYTYVVQPADEPRRASLPVVTIAREYIVMTKDKVYYISLAAPENAAGRAIDQVESVIQTVQLQ